MILHSFPHSHLVLASLGFVRCSQKVLVIECLMLDDTLLIELGIELLLVHFGGHLE